ncbi:hypothetical protein KKH27_01425 [bacterium]|nr:hypothetical protein [bacterium]MBU1983623.1 hypothetical protein [bacterium]
MPLSSTSQPLLCQGPFAITIVLPCGTIVYRNHNAGKLLGPKSNPKASLAECFASPSAWDSIQSKIAGGNEVVDEPVLLQTIHSDTDIYYLTVYPERSETGETDEWVCVWSSHKDRVIVGQRGPDAGTLAQYVHDLEKMIEHRAYQQVLVAEQNEFLGEVVDALPQGLVVSTVDGDVIYRNRAMMEDYGLRPSDYGRPHIRYFLSHAVCEAFAQVACTALRACQIGADPHGIPAVIEILPLIRAGEVRYVVLVFSRPGGGEAQL